MVKRLHIYLRKQGSLHLKQIAWRPPPTGLRSLSIHYALDRQRRWDWHWIIHFRTVWLRVNVVLKIHLDWGTHLVHYLGLRSPELWRVLLSPFAAWGQPFTLKGQEPLFRKCVVGRGEVSGPPIEETPSHPSVWRGLNVSLRETLFWTVSAAFTGSMVSAF